MFRYTTYVYIRIYIYIYIYTNIQIHVNVTDVYYSCIICVCTDRYCRHVFFWLISMSRLSDSCSRQKML